MYRTGGIVGQRAKRDTRASATTCVKRESKRILLSQSAYAAGPGQQATGDALLDSLQDSGLHCTLTHPLK